MERLGGVLERVVNQRRQLRGEPLEYLVELPPTVALEASLDLARSRLGWALMRRAEACEALADVDLVDAARPIRKADDDVQRALKLAREGRRRDVLVAAFGCWCLGLGGRGAREAVYRAGLGFVEVLDAEGGRVYPMAEYCACPIGRELEAEHAPLVAAALERAADAQRGRLWRHVPVDLRNVSLDSYELLDLEPGQREALELVRAWIPARSRWLVLTGAPGVGKSGLAIAAARETNQHWLYVTAGDLIDELRATFDPAEKSRDAVRETDVLASLYDAELVILDELGAQISTDWAAERLFQVIYHREAERKRTIVCTNFRPAQVEAVLGFRGERLLSRIVGAATPFVFTVTGRDLRLKGAEMH